ncbi:hypothetical protein EU527_14060 [Candidatus Thorarchaeota archaeon]|nr:MAG: hypothetical protein EU527_14060 [Candidatus Thorarchaeota archaeon]
MSSDNKKSDEYWMGVRDALRMVDSFNKWAMRNSSRAKSLEDFIHDGLIAAAKRCESCLSEKLGLAFTAEDSEDQDFDEIPVMEEEPQDSEITPVFDEPSENEDEEQDFDSTPEYPLEKPSYMHKESSYEISVEEEPFESELTIDRAEEFEDETPSIDSVERIDDESLDRIETEGPPRDFTTDFVLVEPTPLFVDEHEEESVSSEESIETKMDEDEMKIEVEPDSEIESSDVPPFTWSDYETAVTPSVELEPSDSENDMLPPMDDEIDDVLSNDIEITEPPEPPKIWSPYDESSINDDDESSDELDEDETDGEESEPNDNADNEIDVKGPPPPPPPPESEEDEEERRRRARRLFFGA